LNTAAAPGIIQPGDRYDRANEIQYREETRRRLKHTWKRNADLIIPLGLALGFTAPNGNEYRFSVDGAGALTYGILGSSPVGLASITYVDSVEAGLEGSIASAVSTLTAAYQAADSTLQANISTEATARADADSAEATTRAAADATLTTALGVTNANVTTNTSAIATNTGAISSIQTEITAAREGETNLLAKINVVEAAIVSGDSALASSITSLTATVGGNTSNITTIQTALAGGSGSLALLAFQVNTGTNAAEFKLISVSGGTWNGSAISLTADEITLNGNVIVNGTLTAGKIVSAALGAASYHTPQGSDLSTSFAEKATADITTTGGTVEIDFCVTLVDGGGSIWGMGTDEYIEIVAQLKRGGTTIVDEIFLGRWGADDPTGSGGKVFTFKHLDNPSSGSYTYSVEMKKQSGNVSSGNGDPRLFNPRAFTIREIVSGPTGIDADVDPGA
jgi:hypothetical protein